MSLRLAALVSALFIPSMAWSMACHDIFGESNLPRLDTESLFTQPKMDLGVEVRGLRPSPLADGSYKILNQSNINRAYFMKPEMRAQAQKALDKIQMESLDLELVLTQATLTVWKRGEFEKWYEEFSGYSKNNYLAQEFLLSIARGTYESKSLPEWVQRTIAARFEAEEQATMVRLLLDASSTLHLEPGEIASLPFTQKAKKLLLENNIRTIGAGQTSLGYMMKSAHVNRLARIFERHYLEGEAWLPLSFRVDPMAMFNPETLRLDVAQGVQLKDATAIITGFRTVMRIPVVEANIRFRELIEGRPLFEGLEPGQRRDYIVSHSAFPELNGLLFQWGKVKNKVATVRLDDSDGLLITEGYHLKHQDLGDFFAQVMVERSVSGTGKEILELNMVISKVEASDIISQFDVQRVEFIMKRQWKSFVESQNLKDQNYRLASDGSDVNILFSIVGPRGEAPKGEVDLLRDFFDFVATENRVED